MSTIVQRTVRFLRDETGPTAIEYALLAGLLVLVILTAIMAIGQATSTCR